MTAYRKSLIIAALVLLAASSSQAQMYKCTVAGKTTYSDRHRDNVRREQAKADHAKERAFMECGRVLD